MIDFGFEDSSDSMAAAERADLQEALLQGKLSREEFDYLLNQIIKYVE
jgi:hypothetical protein